MKLTPSSIGGGSSLTKECETPMWKAVIRPFVDFEYVEEITTQAYPIVFGGEPWNEGYRCPICRAEFPSKYEGKLCPACEKKDKRSVLLVECWPRAQVLADFYREMQKPNALCLAMGEDEKMTCFAWGYEITVDQEIDAHLSAPGLSQMISGTYFYLDEVGVLPEYQGQGIGTKMTSWICSAQKQKKILLRTKKDSPMHRIITKLKGRVLLEISNNRVIMELES